MRQWEVYILPPLPPEFNALYSGNSLHSEHFLSNLRKYNCAFQMTSFGCKEINLSGWNPNFRIQGQVCHLIGSLAPHDDQNAAFFFYKSISLMKVIKLALEWQSQIILDQKFCLIYSNLCMYPIFM